MTKKTEDKENKADNIYKKIQAVRCALQKLELKKTGENKYSNFKYYELADILPHINNLNNEYGLFNIIDFSNPELATLGIINSDNTEEVVTFSTPVEKAILKGAQLIQNLGATQTYLRRYLYMSAYEIVESDVVDSQPKEILTVEILNNKLSKCTNVDELNLLFTTLDAKDQANKVFCNLFTNRKKQLTEEVA